MNDNGALYRRLEKLECCRFVADAADDAVCQCGESRGRHWNQHLHHFPSGAETPWRPSQDTIASPTDAYGTIHFDGSDPNRAPFVRLSHRSPPDLVFRLMLDQWRLARPKLLVSVHGGRSNFKLPPRLKAQITAGLLHTAKSTETWIVTDGVNTGVSRRIGIALKSERTPRVGSAGRVVSVGVAPWGVLENRWQLSVANRVVASSTVDRPRSKFAVLNNCHAAFLLVDDGTVGRYGAEVAFRRNLEEYIAGQPMASGSSCTIPMVCLVIEGGMHTIRKVRDCVERRPPVPVVVCAGSGRAADLIADAVGRPPDDCGDAEWRRRLGPRVVDAFGADAAETLLDDLRRCAARRVRPHVHVFQCSSSDGGYDARPPLDQVILRAALRSMVSSHHDDPCSQSQLMVVIAWNRVDIALSEVFVYGREWPDHVLERAMMFALDRDRVDFVRILLEKGVHMAKFLTIERLQELYHSKNGPANALRYLLNRCPLSKNSDFNLVDIGLLLNRLMGGQHRSAYTKRTIRRTFKAIKREQKTAEKAHHTVGSTTTAAAAAAADYYFPDPFHHLLLWAVLTMRISMAQLLWQHGQEVLAKALVASQLFNSMAKEMGHDAFTSEYHKKFQTCSARAQARAMELLQLCHRRDPVLARQLMSLEMTSWSGLNCLRLAHACGHQELMAHPCSQWILSDIWMGRLHTRPSVNLAVILTVLFPPLIFVAWHYKQDTSECPVVCSIDDQILDDRAPQKKLSVLDEVRHFYYAPITIFWIDVLAYAAFLSIFTLTMLVRLPADVGWNEGYVIAYLATFAGEQVRQILTSKAATLRSKLDIWTQNWWNFSDSLAVVEFFVALFFRLQPSYVDVGRVLYCVAIAYWYVRVLRIFSVFQFLGPFVTMMAKMVGAMVHFLSFLLVVILAYGVFRQSLLRPLAEPSLSAWRDVVFEPHFMIYGELFIDGVDPPCGAGEEVEECAPGRWLEPVAMVVFLLVSSVLLVNVLIAIFNSIYEEMHAVAQRIWKFQRFTVVSEYADKPVLPPPFVVLAHLYRVVDAYRKWDDEIDRQAERQERWPAASGDDSAETGDASVDWNAVVDGETPVLEFEAECTRDLMRVHADRKGDAGVDERLQSIGDRIDGVDQQLSELRSSLRSIEARLEDAARPRQSRSAPSFQRLSFASSEMVTDGPSRPVMDNIEAEARHLRHVELREYMDEGSSEA